MIPLSASTGDTLSYDVLIVTTGLKLCWDKIEGLTEALGQGGVCSNYSKEFAPYTWEAIQAFQGGNAVFTCPPMPIKCPGAPQKIAYMADDVFKKKRLSAKVIYATATPGIFGIPAYAAPLREDAVQLRRRAPSAPAQARVTWRGGRRAQLEKRAAHVGAPALLQGRARDGAEAAGRPFVRLRGVRRWATAKRRCGRRCGVTRSGRGCGWNGCGSGGRAA
jgi:hypothetical protein